MAKKKAKKAGRCSRKTKVGKRCKAKAKTGRKTCVSHGPKKKAKKKAKKVVRKKAKKKVSKKRAKKKVIRKKSGVRRTKAKCRMLLTTGKRCKCYCEPGGVYCLTHRKKAKDASLAKIRKNPNPASINVPW